MLYFSGPQVSLGSEVLDFGRIHAGGTATKSLNIVNESDVPAAFQVRNWELILKFRLQNCDNAGNLARCFSVLSVFKYK